MAVVALKDGYGDQIESRDKVENFHGNNVVYLHWENHNMFCSALAFPLPPDMPFGALLQEVIPEYYGMHPDFAQIDWDKVRWSVDGKDFTPDPGKSLADHGVHHKSLIRFWTPGLDGYHGSST
jgi:phenol hydroxylase P4 protein